MHIKYNSWKNIFFLLLLYLTAHFLLLFSRVIMWDGWLWTDLLKQKDYETLYQLFLQAGLLHIYAVYRAIDSLGNPVVISNALVFVGWFIAGVCVYLISKDFARFGEKSAVFIASVFLLVPIFIVRFEISMLTYSLSNTSFFLAAYIFLLTTRISKIFIKVVLQILAVIFFIGAFFTASFLVFYGSLILFLFTISLKDQSFSFSSASLAWANAILIFLKKNIFWIVLPFLFYFVQRKLIGTPHGLYEGYNSFIFSIPGITFLNFFSILVDRVFQFIVYGFFGPIFFSTSILQRKLYFGIFAILFACILFIEKKFRILADSAEANSSNDNISPKTTFIAGVLLFIFGASAYILVGESPNPYGSGFDMRHGLILPLGFSLIVLSMISGLLNNKIRNYVKIFILAIFITYNIYNYYAIDMDRYKQIGIIEGFREEQHSRQILGKDIFVFYDQLPLYIWRGRSIKDHEYTAYLYEATGNPKLMGTSVGGDLRFVSMVKKDDTELRTGRAKERFKNIVIKSEASIKEPTVKNWIKLKLAELFFGKDEFLFNIKKLVGVKIIISDQTPKEISWFD